MHLHALDRSILPSSLFCFLLLLQMEDQGEQRALLICQEKKGLCDPPQGRLSQQWLMDGADATEAE